MHRSFAWRRARRAVCAMALLVFASSCFLEDIFGPLTYALRGTIRDARDQTDEVGPLPVAGIVVRLHGDPDRFATTGVDGRFDLAASELGGCFNISLVLDEASSHPAGYSVCGGGRDIEGLNFTILPGPGHRIEGTVSGAPGALVNSCCVSITHHVIASDGSFAFDNVPFFPYEIRAGILNDNSTVFTPSVIPVHAYFDFEHVESGNGTLGTVTISSIMAGAANASGCFEVLITGDGTGTIRLKPESENLPGVCPPYGAIYYDGQEVLVNFATDLGPMTITIDRFHGWVLQASSPSFTITERLSPATGLHFTKVVP